jgi:hypothetical protein
MNANDIVKKIMLKLHKYLTQFHYDITNPIINPYNNIIQFDKDCLDLNFKNMNNKFNNFQKNENIQNIIKEYIIDIYNKKIYNTLNYINQ